MDTDNIMMTGLVGGREWGWVDMGRGRESRNNYNNINNKNKNI